MTIAVGARSSETAVLAVVHYLRKPAAVTSQLLALAAYVPPQAREVRTSQFLGLVPYSKGGDVVARSSQLTALIVYATGVPGQQRSRAWTCVLDGHTFYVLNLSSQGTFVYDTTTQQWAQFDTDGFGQWNMNNGVQWGERIVAGDTITNQVWELDPSAVLDEGWRDIRHISTGGLSTRSRVYLAVDSLRISASVGQLDEVNGATLSLRYSDDEGKTWSQYFTIPMTANVFDDGSNSEAELAFRSLGSFMAPGRIFEVSDVGGLLRIDGCDAFIDGFDDDTPRQEQKQGG